MLIPVTDVLVNRAPITRRFGVAGIPVYQMSTHASLLADCYHRPETARRLFGRYVYNAIMEASSQGGGYKRVEPLLELVDDIRTRGVRKPIDGWLVGSAGATKLALFGGHHRVLVAYLKNPLGGVSVEVKPLNAFAGMSVGEVRAVYDKVARTENLKRGQSYNYFPGMTPIRQGQDRLALIYEAVIDCPGDALGDFGCNDGYFGVELSAHDFAPTFIDRSRAYMDVVKAKMKLLSKQAEYHVGDLTDVLRRTPRVFAVTLYIDVFYHTVLEKGLNAGWEQLNLVLERTSDRMIFAPGRWDKLVKAGCCQRDVFDRLLKHSRQIRFLGKDNDTGYQREIYCVTRR